MKPVREGVVGQGTLRIDLVVGVSRIGSACTESIRSNARRRPARARRRRGDRHQAGVAASFRGRVVGRFPKRRQTPLAAGRDKVELEPLRGCRKPPGAATPIGQPPDGPSSAGPLAALARPLRTLEEPGRLKARLPPGLGEFPAGRHSNLDDVGALPDERLRLLGGGPHLGRLQGHSSQGSSASPSTSRMSRAAVRLASNRARAAASSRDACASASASRPGRSSSSASSPRSIAPDAT